jgi:hypothetical protein
MKKLITILLIILLMSCTTIRKERNYYRDYYEYMGDEETFKGFFDPSYSNTLTPCQLHVKFSTWVYSNYYDVFIEFYEQPEEVVK